jgi:hypothetical protein
MTSKCCEGREVNNEVSTNVVNGAHPGSGCRSRSGGGGGESGARQHWLPPLGQSALYDAVPRRSRGPEPSAAAGVYFTEVNVLNPTAETAEFEYRVSVSGTPLSDPVTVELGPDETLTIGCEGLPSLFCPIDNLCFDFVLLSGFLIIDSPVELDVVAVYSAREAEGQVKTLDVEPIEAR